MLRNQLTSILIHICSIIAICLFLVWVTPILLIDFMDYGFFYATFLDREKMIFVFAGTLFVHVLYYLFGGLFLKPLNNRWQDFLSTISVTILNCILFVVFLIQIQEENSLSLVALLIVFVLTPSIALWLGLQSQFEKRQLKSEYFDDLDFQLKQNKSYVPEKKEQNEYEKIAESYLKKTHPESSFTITGIRKQETYISVLIEDSNGVEGSIYILKSNHEIYYDSFRMKK